MASKIRDVRITPDSGTISRDLGLLADLAGTWQGHGFNLIARPDFEGQQPLYLQLNQTDETRQYAFSAFPSFNSTPFPIPNPAVPTGFKINAAGSSEFKSAPGGGGGFPSYTLTNPDSAAVPRTPFDTNPPDPPLPAEIDGVAMQDVVDDPILLLQAVVKSQVAEGYTFEGAALNITTEPTITFLTMVNDPGGPSQPVTVTDGAGGLANSLFLEGASQQGVVGGVGPNALTSLVYATFWIEKVSHPERDPFMQLQYAQMTVLNFNVLNVSPPVLLGWPHVSVGTLRKSF